jgi:hypothetical protein
MTDEFSGWEREILEHFLILGHEVAATAIALRARYVSAQIRLSADELVLFSFEAGRVWATGRGYEVELTPLRNGDVPRTARRILLRTAPLTGPARGPPGSPATAVPRGEQSAWGIDATGSAEVPAG